MSFQTPCRPFGLAKPLTPRGAAVRSEREPPAPLRPRRDASVDRRRDRRAGLRSTVVLVAGLGEPSDSWSLATACAWAKRAACGHSVPGGAHAHRMSGRLGVAPYMRAARSLAAGATEASRNRWLVPQDLTGVGGVPECAAGAVAIMYGINVRSVRGKTLPGRAASQTWEAWNLMRPADSGEPYQEGMAPERGVLQGRQGLTRP